MKERYESPIITKNVSGFSNKFGMSSKLDVIDNIDGVNIESLLKEHGSPLFVFSERTIRKRYQRYLNAFKRFYPKTKFAWSYKTNYLQAIASIYHDEGSIAEVVSGFEYEKAKKLGVDPKDIIYNGPYKTEDSLRVALKDGAKIHIDHFDELATIEKMAEELNINPKVAIRINMDTGIYPQWSRFGFNYENGEAERVIKRIYRNGRLKLNGLHTHIGTFVLSPDAYKNALGKLINLYNLANEKYDFKIEYLDLGGGFPSKNKLKAQYLPTSLSIPSVEQYAEKITDYLLDHFSVEDGPDLYFETGRALIDEAGYLLSTVHATKRMPDSRRAVIIDAGVNLLFTAFFYDINVAATKSYHGTMENSIIYGPLCMNIDVIRESIKLPYLTPGDNLVLHPVGAYGVTQWMQFIQMRPAVVLINESGKVVKIRRAETIEDVETPEILPKEYALVEEI
jgi:diaminopimelate decarboxylase